MLTICMPCSPRHAKRLIMISIMSTAVPWIEMHIALSSLSTPSYPTSQSHQIGLPTYWEAQSKRFRQSLRATSLRRYLNASSGVRCLGVPTPSPQWLRLRRLKSFLSPSYSKPTPAQTLQNSGRDSLWTQHRKQLSTNSVAFHRHESRAYWTYSPHASLQLSLHLNFHTPTPGLIQLCRPFHQMAWGLLIGIKGLHILSMPIWCGILSVADCRLIFFSGMCL